jgi:hypothetical protein
MIRRRAGMVAANDDNKPINIRLAEGCCYRANTDKGDLGAMILGTITYSRYSLAAINARQTARQGEWAMPNLPQMLDGSGADASYGC